MPQYLYRFCELLSASGAGTPEDPGGDFSLDCWIEAPDANTALQWGHVLLGDYYQKRFALSDSASHFQGKPVRDGEIEADHETIARLREHFDLPKCHVGEIPKWHEPWRISNLERKQDIG